MTDFENELVEASETVFQRTHVIGIRLTEDEHRTIRDTAACHGLDEATLIHEWVREKLGHR